MFLEVSGVPTTFWGQNSDRQGQVEKCRRFFHWRSSQCNCSFHSPSKCTYGSTCPSMGTTGGKHILPPAVVTHARVFTFVESNLSSISAFCVLLKKVFQNWGHWNFSKIPNFYFFQGMFLEVSGVPTTFWGQNSDRQGQVEKCRRFFPWRSSQCNCSSHSPSKCTYGSTCPTMGTAGGKHILPPAVVIHASVFTLLESLLNSISVFWQAV